MMKYSIFLIILSILITCFNVDAYSETIRANYLNILVVPPGKNPPANQSSSAMFFNGHIGRSSVNNSIVLSQSSFCQPFSRDIPYPGFIENSLNTALKMLYYEYAPGSESEKKEAAFSYRILLYQKKEVDAKTYITAQFDSISDYWTEAKRNKALEAAEIIKDALKFAHYDKNLRWVLLDIFYDIAVADLAVAKEKIVQTYKYSLGISPPSPGELIISKEIDLLEEALVLYRESMKGYFDLLKDRLGVMVSSFDNDAPENMPFGYYMFKKEVPQRSLNSPLFKDKNGNWILPQDKTDDDIQYEIFKGYKDLVLLFNIQRDYVRCASQLVKRYIQRKAQGDIEKAKKHIGDIEQTSYVEGNILLDIFPDCIDNDRHIE